MELSFKEQVVKNVGFNVLKTIISKFGAFIFTILIARLLLPELYGLYSLALSILIIFGTFSDLGLSSAVVKYVSENLGLKKIGKAAGYFRFFFKIRFWLVLSSCFVLFLIAKSLAVDYFMKPELFYIFLVTLIYLFISQIEAHVENLFYINKDVRYSLISELILQISRIVFAFVSVTFFEGVNKIIGLFFGLALSYLLMLIFCLWYLFKKSKYILSAKVSEIDRTDAWKFLFLISVASASLVLFANVDSLILGRFVSAEYIGYYKVAFSAVVALSSLLSILLVLFPLFAQLKKSKLISLVNNAVKYTLILAIPIAAGLVLLNKYIIVLLFGLNYASASYVIYSLAVLIVFVPLTGIFSTLIQAKGLVKKSALIGVFALFVNLLLTYTFVKISESDQLIAIILTGLSITISYLLMLLLSYYYVIKNIGVNVSLFGYAVKPLVATFVMSSVLFIYLYFVSNLFFVLLSVIVGIIVYFVILYLIKGITRDDVKYIKVIFKTR
jgi:O-antigen/teichoic acid export membrane protein